VNKFKILRLEFRRGKYTHTLACTFCDVFFEKNETKTKTTTKIIKLTKLMLIAFDKNLNIFLVETKLQKKSQIDR